jgi:hypothetical protein
MQNFLKHFGRLPWINSLIGQIQSNSKIESLDGDLALVPEIAGGSIPAGDGDEYLVLKRFVEAFSGAHPPDTLMFGDSVALRVADDDLSGETLGGIVSAGIAPGRFHLVADSGYHIGVFEQYCRLLEHLPRRPELVVLPINLRSFSPTWDLNPLYQFMAEIEVLKSFEVALPCYRISQIAMDRYGDEEQICSSSIDESSITLKQFQELIEKTPAHGSDDWRNRLHNIFKWHYGVLINLDHRKLLSLKNTIEKLQGLGIPVYAYFTPINHESGWRFCGPKFEDIVKKNISTIQTALNSLVKTHNSNVQHPVFKLDDFSTRFGKDSFFTEHNATEHVRFAAREFLAQQIIDQKVKIN